MDRVTYEYQKFTSVNGGDSILNKIYTFAVAQGWTATYYEQNKSWDDEAVPDYYDWGTEGTLEDHLELVSNGYGNQTLRFRFRNIIQSGTENRLQVRAIDPNEPDLDHGSSSYPTDQNDWTYTSDFSFVSLPASTFPEMAIVGNDKVIMVFFFVNSFISYMLCFGSYELIPEYQDTDELQMQFNPHDISGGSWENLSDPNYSSIGFWYPCFLQSSYHTWWEGARSLTSSNINVKKAFRVSRTSNFENLQFSTWGELCCLNSFSGYRTFLSWPVFVKDSDVDTWNHIGHLPAYVIPWAGLDWGDFVTRGDDTYIVFPMFYTTGDYGVAIKVNIP